MANSKTSNYRKVILLSNELKLNTSDLRKEYRSSKASFWIAKLADLQRRKLLSTVSTNIPMAYKKRSEIVELKNLIRTGQYEQAINSIVFMNYTITKAILTDLWNRIQAAKYVLSITFEDGKIQNITLSNKAKAFFMAIMTNKALVTDINEPGSDTLENIDISQISEISLINMTVNNRSIENKDGRFFPYINTSNIDLSRYQIYNNTQASQNLDDEHCLIHTLALCGIEMALINEIKLSYVAGANICKKDMKLIANIIKKNITIHSYTSGYIRKQNIKCENKTSECIQIAMHSSHYFAMEDTSYSRYSINNYKEINTIENYNRIVSGENKNGKIYYEFSDDRKISSLALVEIFLKNSIFIKEDMSKFSCASDSPELKNHIYLDNIECEQREVTEYKEKPNKSKIFYADCESFVTETVHKLFLLGVISDSSDNVEILTVENGNTQAIVWKFLSILTGDGKNNSIVYFHNLKYDYHLIEPLLNIRDRCEKNGQLYSVTASYKGKSIEFRDSYKLIPFALAKFTEEFNLDKEICKKEAMAYTYYTTNNVNKIIHTDEYRKLLSFEEQKIFDIVIKLETTYDEKTETFNPTEYYKSYLKLDCLVLKKGMQKFAALIEEVTDGKMSLYNSLTISSLTDRFMKLQGAYDGVYEMTGNLREYVSNAVYGGRVNVNPEYKKKVINGKISDYDGVSLYPSAINRLCREIGLPTGKAIRYTKENLSTWSSNIYSILTVKITKVNKIQQMPFIAVKNEDSTEYTNEVPIEDLIIDSITLEDYIKFHEIEYELIDGVYWNSGVNKKMAEVVQSLFKKRLEYAKSNIALANTLKLMLNSAYGKTIMKKTNTKKSIIKSEVKVFNKSSRIWETTSKTNFNDYIYNNFNTIKAYRKLNESSFEVEQLCADISYNRGHIGCAILSMSKRIMNEVFDIANNNKLPIYYTDTDSIHCNLDDVQMLENKYKDKYNKELNGKNLEQFHVDFKLKGAVTEIYATTSIFLGKKSYIDELISTDKDGNKIVGHHIRLKGITKEGLLDASKKYENGYMELYKDLAMGTKVTIILNPFNVETNKSKVLFEFANGHVSTKKEFTREVSF